MTKTRLGKLITGVMVLSLLAIGVTALAGNGFGRAAEDDWAGPMQAEDCACYAWERDFDNDGIPNCEDPDYERPLDGTGHGHGRGR